MLSEVQIGVGAIVVWRLVSIGSHLVFFPAWILFEGWRQFGAGDPALPSFADHWIATEPIFLALLTASAFEAYGRIAVRYRKGIRAMLIVGGFAAVLATALAMGMTFKPQAAVAWQRSSLKNL